MILNEETPAPSPSAALGYEKSPDVLVYDAWSTSSGVRLHNAMLNCQIASCHRSTHPTSPASMTPANLCDASGIKFG